MLLWLPIQQFFFDCLVAYFLRLVGLEDSEDFVVLLNQIPKQRFLFRKVLILIFVFVLKLIASFSFAFLSNIYVYFTLQCDYEIISCFLN